MEGFDPVAVGREFGLPENAEVIALLAIGFAKMPDKAYGGRLELAEIVHDEHFGNRWNEKDDVALKPVEKTFVKEDASEL